MNFSWNGTDQRLLNNMIVYQNRVLVAVRQVARYFVPIMEDYAKTHAPWTDRTANARQTLHSWFDELAGGIIMLYVAHGMDYGKWLELKNQDQGQSIRIPGIEVEQAGKYAIILPTIQAHFDQILNMIQEVLS